MLETILRRRARLNRTFSVDISYSPASGLRVEWEPDVPRGVDLNDHERDIYRRARDELLAEVAERTGQRVMVVEL